MEVQDFIKEREALFGAFLFGLFLAYKVWVYAITGLKNQKITVWSKGAVITKLRGKKAIYFALFWFVVAVLLTLVLAKFMCLLTPNPKELF